MNRALLQVRLTAGYGTRTVLNDLTFSLAAGERLGLVGSSGAGKSTLLLALLGLLPWRGGWTRGEVSLNGRNLLGMKERDARKLRGKTVALVPQSPVSALNSALSLQTHFREAWRAHEPADKLKLQQRTELLLHRVQLPSDPGFLKRKPSEISVGQAQRCAIALALLHRPALVIADEPTSALDPSTQVEVLELLREISAQDDTALLFVSHDLLSVFRICRRVALLHQGRIEESLPIDQIARARHPALRDLLRTLPVPPEVLLEHAARNRGTGMATPSHSELVTPMR